MVLILQNLSCKLFCLWSVMVSDLYSSLECPFCIMTLTQVTLQIIHLYQIIFELCSHECFFILNNSICVWISVFMVLKTSTLPHSIKESFRKEKEQRHLSSLQISNKISPDFVDTLYFPPCKFITFWAACQIRSAQTTEELETHNENLTET